MDRRRLDPVASGRLQFVNAQTLAFTLKTPWADGTTSLLLSPQELLEKLAALVPPPRLHLIRYHGVLAPAAADRAEIVPGPSALTAVSDDGVGAGGMKIIAALTAGASVFRYLEGVGLPSRAPPMRAGAHRRWGLNHSWHSTKLPESVVGGPSWERRGTSVCAVCAVRCALFGLGGS